MIQERTQLPAIPIEVRTAGSINGSLSYNQVRY